VERPTVTLVAEPPRQRRARPELVGLPYLNTCASIGQPRTVLVDGERFRVDAVEPDDSAEGYMLVSGVMQGRFQPLSFPDDTMFELADPE
jgi:hypothetical protein